MQKLIAQKHQVFPTMKKKKKRDILTELTLGTHHYNQ